MPLVEDDLRRQIVGGPADGPRVTAWENLGQPQVHDLQVPLEEIIFAMIGSAGRWAGGARREMVEQKQNQAQPASLV